ncbi:MAG: sigma-54-dependent Fis family transcriptional regulator, partial [Planctomycetota bacterium]
MILSSVPEAPIRSDQAAHAPGGRVLVVDDHEEARESIAEILRHSDHEVHCSPSAAEALRRLDDESYDVVLTDLNMPGMSGIELIRHLEKREHGAQIVMVTAYASVATAVEAMRRGAFDYIEKPFTAAKIEQLVARAIERGRMLDQRYACDRTTTATAGEANSKATESSGPAMIGESPVMAALRERIAQIAPTLETVLISGESGTGKELVARAVHAQSERAESPLVSLNCPVLSAQLMESELFGHERGAFTGADAPRTGRFELADGGTILLDEITEIELPLQAKLLRVLQERSFERVGTSRSISVDVRVLATTNRDLQDEVGEGRFREDLYFRLAVVPLVVPPLRQRCEDIPLLVAHFKDHAAARLQRDPVVFDSSAEQLLQDYRWPGNVRELQNIVTRASVLVGRDKVSAE